MKKLFPLILAIAIGLGGYLYFNQSVLPKSKVDKVLFYDTTEYKKKKPSPIIKLEKKDPINIVVKTINSSHNIEKDTGVTDHNYVLEMIYSKDKKQVFYLWLNEDTTSAMFQNKEDVAFHIVSKDDTNKLKTLMFR